MYAMIVGVSDFDFREYLNRELSARRKKNPAYSLREFARDLEMSPQKLSQVLRGVTGLSSEAATSLAQKMSLTEHEKEIFLASVEVKHHRSSTVRKLAQQKLDRLISDQGTETVSLENYKKFLDWYFAPIYFMVDFEDFEPSAKYVAKKLKIDVAQAQKAIDLLFEEGLLLKDEKGRWKKGKSSLLISAPKSTEEIRNYYKSHLTKAIESIEEVPPEERDLSVGTVSLNQEDYQWIKEEIKVFRRSLLKKISDKTTNEDRVYALSIQFFPLDRK